MLSLNLALNVNLNGILIFILGFVITCRGHPINQKGLYDLCITENIHLLILWHIFDYKMKDNLKIVFLFLVNI